MLDKVTQIETIKYDRDVSYSYAASRLSTIIHHIMTDNTIDQRVYKALQNKELTQEELMKAIKARIAKHK
ncbi:TPA: hypothetical protein PQ887_001343 [Staphylococcus aureus]|nr:hypothetical protein [Staphylococcus aureus]HEA4267306.1 hypothetical protein [Staphylococcus aureus]